MHNFVADRGIAFPAPDEEGNLAKINGPRLDLAGEKKGSDQSGGAITSGALHNVHSYQESLENCNPKKRGPNTGRVKARGWPLSKPPRACLSGKGLAVARHRQSLQSGPFYARP